MKKKLKDLIAQNKTKQTIKELLSITSQMKDKDLEQEVILQSARFEKYAKANRSGTSSFSEEGISIANINQALLYIIHQLPDEEIRIPSDKNTTNSTNPKNISNADNKISANSLATGKWWKWIVGLGLLLAIPAGLAQMTGYSLKDLIGGGEVDSFSLTVFVHGKNGKDDRILKNQGKVVLDVGTARKEASINEKGEATFKELPAGFIGKKSLISIEHPQPYLPVKRDLEYTLKKSEPIYLAVELKGMGKINGRVLDFESEKPLKNVRVSYQNITTSSDEFGWYELEIPAEKQAKFIRVNFFKEGYKMEDIDSIAPHIKQEIGILLKRQ